ncbi:hypothetical protein ACWDHW_41495 [Streptomyces melanosporofaciens]
MLIGATITALGLVVSVIWAPETKDRPRSGTSAPDGSLPRDQPTPVTQPF